MPDLKNYIKNQIADLYLLEAVKRINSALPSNTNLVGLRARTNQLENKIHSGLISSESYDVGIVNLTRDLFFFIDNLKENDLKKIFIEFVDKDQEKLELIVSILFVAATPKDQDQLQVDYEYSTIKNVISSSFYRDNFQLESPVLALTFDSLVKSVSNTKPSILHFSGHAGKKGIVFSDVNNKAEVIPTSILNDIFESFERTIQCVFLNACYSAEQAKILSNYSNYVIGMNCPIGDEAAITFSEAFYLSLCNDLPINFEKAFKQSKIKLKLKKQDESNIPEIWKGGEKLDL